MSNIEHFEKVKPKSFIDKFCNHLCTCCGIGFGPAPGTLGSIFTTVVHCLAVTILKPNAISLIIFDSFAILLLFVLGLISITTYLKNRKHNKDPKEVIIDEVIGQLISLNVFNTLIYFFLLQKLDYIGDHLFGHIICLTFFRIFDIFKPWPICWVDQKCNNAFGVIADDVLAGLAGGISSFCILWLVL